MINLNFFKFLFEEFINYLRQEFSSFGILLAKNKYFKYTVFGIGAFVLVLFCAICLLDSWLKSEGFPSSLISFLQSVIFIHTYMSISDFWNLENRSAIRRILKDVQGKIDKMEMYVGADQYEHRKKKKPLSEEVRHIYANSHEDMNLIRGCLEALTRYYKIYGLIIVVLGMFLLYRNVLSNHFFEFLFIPILVLVTPWLIIKVWHFYLVENVKKFELLVKQDESHYSHYVDLK